jgi:hypothetical protein
MQVSPCNGLSTQRWLKDADGTLRSARDPDSCLDVEMSQFNAGARIQVRLLLLLLSVGIVPHMHSREHTTAPLPTLASAV